MIILSKDVAYSPNEFVSDFVCASMVDRKLNLLLLKRKTDLPVNFSLTELVNRLTTQGLGDYFLSFKSHVINLYYLYHQFLTLKISGQFIRRYFVEKGVAISRDQAQCISKKLKTIKKEQHKMFVAIDPE